MANCSCHRVLHSSRRTTALWQRGGHRSQRRVEPTQPVVVVVGTQGLTHQAAVAAVAAVAVVVLAAVVAEAVAAAVSAAGAVVVFKEGQPQPAAQAWLVLDVLRLAPGDCMLMMLMMMMLHHSWEWDKPRLWQLSHASLLSLWCWLQL